MYQPDPRPKRPGTVVTASVLMVIHGLIWLYAAWVTIGGGLPTALLTTGMLAVGGWSVAAPFGFGPGRAGARTSALTVTLLAIVLELLGLGVGLYLSLDTSGCPPEGCEPVGVLFAFLVALLAAPPLTLATITVLLLAGRSARGYLTNPP